MTLLTRNDPFTTKRYRTRFAGNANFDGLDSLETQTVYEGNLGSGATTLYTSPSTKRARTAGGLVLLHNPTGGGITADLHLVPSGGSTDSTNKMAATVTVAAGETRLYFDRSIRQVVLPGGSLVINTGSAGLNAWMIATEEREEVCSFFGGFIGNLGTGETTIATVPATHSFFLENLVVYNPTGGNRVLTAHFRESGVAAGTANQIENQGLPSATGYTLVTDLLPSLSENGLVSGLGDIAGLNVWASGVLL